jgi:hypothetical protein
VYCRNFSWEVGQPASFEEKDAHPSAVEYLLGALSASLSTGFASEASRAGLQVDDIEIATHGQLENGLALLGLGDGEPSSPASRSKLLFPALRMKPPCMPPGSAPCSARHWPPPCAKRWI